MPSSGASASDFVLMGLVLMGLVLLAFGVVYRRGRRFSRKLYRRPIYQAYYRNRFFKAIDYSIVAVGVSGAHWHYCSAS